MGVVRSIDQLGTRGLIADSRRLVGSIVDSLGFTELAFSSTASSSKRGKDRKGLWLLLDREIWIVISRIF